MSIFSNAYTTEQKVQAVFIGLLGRNAKTSGLDHYVAAIDNPTNNFGIAEMLSELVNSQVEYINAVAGMGRAQLVAYVFDNLFNRLPTFDSEGNNYWINGAGAAVPADQLVTALIAGASATDQLVLENQISVAIYMEQHPGLTNAEAKAILDTVTNSPASVVAAKGLVDAGLDPTGQTYQLTAGQDLLTGTSKDDTFTATQNTLQTGDNLNGGNGHDTLILSVQGSSDFFAAPTLTSIETIRVNAPNFMGDYIELDLSNADGYNTLESFQTTSYWGPGYASLWFYDIQNVNGTDIRIIDTNLDHYFSYDTNAYLPGNGVDAVDLYLSEVDGSYIEFYNEGTNDWSNVDRVNITSAQRNQINNTTFNYVYALEVGGNLTHLYIDGDADFEIEEIVNGYNNSNNNLKYVNASGLNADLWLDLEAQGLGEDDPTLTVIGAQGDDNIDIYGDGNNEVHLGTGDDDLRIYGDGLNQITTGAGEDYVYIEGNVVGGRSTIDTGADNDVVVIYGNGNYDIDLGTGHDWMYIYGNGNQWIDAGEGDDYVYIEGNGYHNINLGDGEDVLYIDGAGGTTEATRTIINGGAGEDYVFISANHRLTVDLGDDNDTIDLRAEDLSGQDIIDGGDGIDTMVLRNAAGGIPEGRVTQSETNATSSIEVFDLRDQNIYLELDDNLFASAQNNTITVVTTSANGTQTVDLTNIEEMLTDTFNLVGGVYRDIVVVNDETANGLGTLAFGDSIGEDQLPDTLRVVDGATLRDEDLEGISGLELIELVSNSNSAQTWTIELNALFINQTSLNSDLVIRVDQNVPAQSNLYIVVDPNEPGVVDDVVIERGANVNIYLNGVLVTEPQFGSPLITFPGVAGATLTVKTALYYTSAAGDNLMGTDGNDTFIANALTDVQSADVADGKLGYDTLQLNFAVANPLTSLQDQLENTGLISIERLLFNTGNNVQMNTIGLGYFSSLQDLVTGAGNDTLNNMRSGVNYYLNSGDDYLSTWIGGGTWYVDGGLGQDTIQGSNSSETIYGEDVEFIYAEYGDDNIYISQDIDTDKAIYVNGGGGEDSLGISGKIGGTVTADWVEYISDSSQANVIVANWSNTGTIVVDAGGGADTVTVGNTTNATVNGGSGNDTITINNTVTNALVNGGDDNDTILVNASGAVTVNGDSGNDLITVNVGATAVVNGGTGNDTLNVNTGSGDFATITGGAGNDSINLLVNASGGQDRVVFGDIVYNALQQVTTNTQGVDVINGFNFELGGAGVEDQLDFSAFLNLYTGPAVAAIQYGDWTGTGTVGNASNVDLYNVAVANAQRPFAVIAADADFVLNTSHIVQGIAGDTSQLGIEIQDNNRAVVIVAKDVDGILGFETFDVYFVQDVDQDAGSAWAINHVATINAATQIGAITSVDIDNLPAYNWA